ncbi:hypothetical protein AGABI2DRAFT_186400 [Agaricus bisporus var. bisporus H97]|uniref:hypothetical protein n=1 Tax=Agaricus bisporus var. bisporus (strain H97 / ATCC MYA-4626 / FGSC 10389) TaxID=936046 RepID=UPI00029F68E6|nr:hypothetical protein AGABI2DRAFT_186400 [Agaricus bisporus var. bisporus H97]EKV45679.1 hypothetical protein AGABI2DRAFT_186400 [Agaricus bisporus var. bisporus H97]
MADVIKQLVHEGLSHPVGEKNLPTILLYDERGLKLYDKITTQAAEYYPFQAEEQILKRSADDIVRMMHGSISGPVADEVVLELGAGALRKTSLLLAALARLIDNDSSNFPITYYALDLERSELERTLGDIEQSPLGNMLQDKVETKGICGTYDDGLKFLSEGGFRGAHIVGSLPDFTDKITNTTLTRNPPSADSSDSRDSRSTSAFSTLPSSPGDPAVSPFHILFLGSSLGNFPRADAVKFLRGLPLRSGYGDTLLIGLDHDNDTALVEKAYNDTQGHTTEFIMNGLRAAGRVLGNEELFNEKNWEYVNKYDAVSRHEAFLKAKVDHSINSPGGNVYVFKADELLKIEESFKFSYGDATSLFTEAGLRPIQRWVDNNSRYSLWLVERPPFVFPLMSSSFACNRSGELVPKKAYSTSPFGIPAREEWDNSWALWDFITLRMIPRSMLHEKPIHLRHICLFYIGHIPAFLDIQLSRLLNEPHTEPERYKDIFERGIDPDVDNPTECHPHSIVPTKTEEWPTLAEILRFQESVRSRVMSIYDDIESGKHLLSRQLGRLLFMTLEHEAHHAETLLYMLLQRAGTGTIPPPGFAEPDWQSLAAAWDAEPRPESEIVTLGPEMVSIGHDDLEADDDKTSKVSEPDHHEYGWDLEHPERKLEVQQFKISWRPVTNGEFYEFYLGQEGDKIELPASWVVEDDVVRVRTIYGPISMDLARHWPLMTSYDNLSAYAMVKGGRLPTEPELRLFYDKFNSGYEGGANVAFRNWHPLPATTGGAKNDGKGHNGGVWEWTSTELDRVDGYVPSKLYPGYSNDFMDGKHHVVLGASYATAPRVSERRSFRNWYQRSYPYAWIGGRIVYDK